MSENLKKEFEAEYQAQIQEIPLPDKIKQQYHIVEVLKESENKNVFLLEDSDGNRTVLKQYHKEYEQLSKNEYEILRTLQKTSNPCFPKPVDYFVQDGYAYILREYVEGDSLLNLYENGRLESEEKVLQLSIMMCRILSILHEQKPPMIHRDVKPENFVFQAKQNRLSLIDCDSVRFYKNGQEHDTLFFGTPTHAAPEAYGYCQCDVRSDVFGLGKTILFLCCGRTDDLAVEECDISKELLVIIKKCIAFSPQERYSKVVYIEQELKKLYDRNYHKASKSFKITYVLGTLAAVTLAFFAGMFFYKNYEERSSVETNKTDAVASNHTVASEKDDDKGKDEGADGKTGNGADEETDNGTDEKTDSGADEDNGNGADDEIHTPEPVGDDVSLAESADRVTIDVSGYEEQVNQIIQCYYEMDLEGMGDAYDSLFTKLYAAEDLKSIPWTDISKLETVPGNYAYRPYPKKVCDPLACYDRILFTKIGHFRDYAGDIYNFLDFFLNEDFDNTKHPLYRYGNGDEEARKENYKETLVELINCAIRGVMDQDCLEFLNPV